jgi:hypothetical protein
MSILPSLTRLKNDIADIEDECDRKVDPTVYYIIKIHLKKYDGDLVDTAKNLIRKKKDHKALLVYVYVNELYFIYSCLDEEQKHYKNGSHQLLCSEYASYFATVHNCDNVECRIIEFASRMKIISYFSYKIFENVTKTILEKSKGVISQKDVLTLTLEELILILESKCKINWAGLSSVEKFGCFYKYDNNKYSIISELINMKDLERYQKYFFDS